jgi:hypothetical protein
LAAQLTHQAQKNESERGVDKLARALSPQPPSIPHDLRRKFEAFETESRQIATETVHRLRNLLHQGKLKAYYFNNDGLQVVPAGFWATEQAGGILEDGRYFPSGRPSWPSYPLCLKQSELEAVLTGQQTAPAEASTEQPTQSTAPAAPVEEPAESAEQPDPYRSGMGGKPTVRHFILNEANDRIDKNIHLPKTIGEFAEELQAWALYFHPSGPVPKNTRAIEALVRQIWRRAVPRKAGKPPG